MHSVEWKEESSPYPRYLASLRVASVGLWPIFRNLTHCLCSQFIPVFEQELQTLATSRGTELSRGFSALELFKRIAVGYNLCVEMMEAAQTIKNSGKLFGINYSWLLKY